MAIKSERRFISINDVKPGMMIQFAYEKKSGGSGTYIVLVVDPKRKNERATEPQLHGYVINQLSDSQLIEFFATFKKTININSEDRRGSVVEGLNTSEAYAQFASSKFVKGRSYRTFNLTGMSQVRQILIGSVED